MIQESYHELSSSDKPIMLYIKSSPMEYQLGYSSGELSSKQTTPADDIKWLCSVSTDIMTRKPPLGFAYTGMMFGLYAFGNYERVLDPADFKYAGWSAY